MNQTITTKLLLPLIGEVILSFNDKDFAEFCLRQIPNHHDANLQKISTVKNEQPLIRLTLQGGKFGALLSNSDSKRKFSRLARQQKNEFIFEECGRFSSRKIVIKCVEGETTIDVWESENYLVSKLKRLLRGGYSYNHSRYYNCFLYVLFSIYYVMYGYKPVHGAVVANDNASVLIYGLDGVGKSTIASQFLDLDYFIPSDNISLVNGGKVINLSQTMRLSKSDRITENMVIVFEDAKLKEVSLPKISKDVIELDFKLLLSMSDYNSTNTDRDELFDDIVLTSSGAPELSSAYRFLSHFFWLKEDVKANDNSSSKHLVNVENELDITINKIKGLMINS